MLSLPSVLSPLSPLLSPLSPSLSPSFSGRSHRHRRSHRPRRPPPQAPLPSCSCPALRRQAGLAPLSATSRSDLGSLSQAEAAGAPILATIRSSADAEQEPCWFTTAPAAAIPKALARAGLSIDDVDLYEVNEAFACVPLAWAKALGADPSKLNVNGGACALGHPLGGTGAKLMTTLVSELVRSQKRFGLQAICEGGGTANATLIERC